MKQIMKGISVAMAALVGVCALAGCGDTGIQQGKSGTLKIHYYVGGFDSDELHEQISDLYEQKTGVRVNWIPSYTYNEIQNLLYDSTNNNDILMPQLGVWRAQDMKILEPLDDVYNATPEGQDHAIKDKMSQNLYDYLKTEDGHVYQMSAMDSVSSLVYNADVLDEFLGEGKWEVPNTTEELWAICDRLNEIGKGVADKTSEDMVYSFVTSSQLLYYWDYLGNVWWAQYDGYESYLNYFEGKYWDEEKETWEMGPAINNTDGRSIALNETAKMLSTGRGYMHADCKDMGYKQAQQVLIGQGFGRNRAKAAFMVNGDWLYTEMSGALASQPADIRMMKPPILSDLIDILPDGSVADDAELSALIDAIDAGSTALQGDGYEVTQPDFDRVKEARSMIYSATYNYPVCIPNYISDTQKQLAKDFLVFYFSDATQKLIAEYNGGTAAPYGYQPETDSMSDFLKSRYECISEDTIVICENPKSRLCYRGGLNDMPAAGSNYIDSLLIAGTVPSKLLEDSYKQLVENWDTMLVSAGITG